MRKETGKKRPRPAKTRNKATPSVVSCNRAPLKLPKNVVVVAVGATNGLAMVKP